jgi:hypothetical protein
VDNKRKQASDPIHAIEAPNMASYSKNDKEGMCLLEFLNR